MRETARQPEMIRNWKRQFTMIIYNQQNTTRRKPSKMSLPYILPWCTYHNICCGYSKELSLLLQRLANLMPSVDKLNWNESGNCKRWYVRVKRTVLMRWFFWAQILKLIDMKILTFFRSIFCLLTRPMSIAIFLLLAHTEKKKTKSTLDEYAFTVLPTKSDSDVMFCLQSYQGLKIDRSLVY